MLRRVATESVRRRPRPSTIWSHPSLQRRAFAVIDVSTHRLPEAGKTRFRPSHVQAAHSVNLDQRRHMSDNLLGHSPMAQRPPIPSSGKSSGPVLGVDANTAGGGVWAQTSAKRDKIGELKVELPEGKRTLDEMATDGQKLDLDLADGLMLVAMSVDGGWTSQSERRDGAKADGSAAAEDTTNLPNPAPAHPVLAELEKFLTDTETSRGPDGTLNQERYDAYLSEVVRILTPDAAAASPSDRLTPYAALARLRDFVEHDPDPDPDTAASIPIPPDVDADLSRAEGPFDECTSYLRILLARAAASCLRDSWDAFTRVTDADVDRAAVRGEVIEPASELSLERVNNVIRSYVTGTCPDRVAALWSLVDRDGDGLIDEVEMNDLARWSMKPVEGALRELFFEAIEAVPVRDPVGMEDATTNVGPAGTGGSKKGWRQRRAEAKVKKRLIKMFDKTIADHFEIEVEIPHRLRCIYAWANKAHQDDKIDSVLVESGTIAGRSRYVELSPKISLDEFRSVQTEHFLHLDRAAEEIVSSFREDLLVDQGKGRQNKELRRDISLFLGVVSLIDAVILML